MLKISTLVENGKLPDERLCAEVGLSFFIEYNEKSILFDCGLSDNFLKNAQVVGVDPLKADMVVLSHGHFDHANGFPEYMSRRESFELYIGKPFFLDRYSVETDKPIRYLGVNFTQDDLDSHSGINVHIADQDLLEIMPGAYIITNFKRSSPFEPLPKRMQVKLSDGGYEQDVFDDEICLVFETAKGLCLIVGCSHPGIANMMEAVRERFSDKEIYAVVGGTHFRDASEQQIINAINCLDHAGTKILGLAHCSGAEVSKYIEGHDAQYMQFCTGKTITLED